MRFLSKRMFSAVLAILMLGSVIPAGVFTAAAVLGDGQQLSVDINLEVGRYVGGFAEVNWIPVARGETLAVDDVVTVRICPESDFLCGITAYVTMFSKEYFEVVGSNTNAFTPNYDNAFYAQVASGYIGATNIPQNAWPAAMQTNEFNEYTAVKVYNTANTNSANGGYPGYMPGGWLFRFDLKVIKAVNAGSNARIWMDNRWFRNPDNITAGAYFVKVERLDQLAATGSSTDYYFDVDLEGADITLSFPNDPNIITFGSYPQSEVTDAGLITTLNAQPLQADDTVNFDGSRYKRVYFTNPQQAINGYNINTVYWFKYEPIQWRVLSDIDGELFVMAEKVLGSRAYNQVSTNVTWETCTMRSWLNNGFYSEAFDATERYKIKTSQIINDYNPWFGTTGGNNTSDKLFLLSYSEMTNPDYGFNSTFDISDTARRAQGTDFSKSQGLYVELYSTYFKNISWWLRSPGGEQRSAGYVTYDGNFSDYGNFVSSNFIGVRPAMKISRKPEILMAAEGTTCLIDYDKMIISGLSPGVTSLTGYVSVAGGYELSYIPSANGFGTGTIVNITKDGITIDSYTILLYGDVNGDGSIDSLDAGIMVDYENYLIPWEPAADAAYLKAADLNGDNSIDSLDAGITVDAENYVVTIDQTTGLVV